MRGIGAKRSLIVDRKSDPVSCRLTGLATIIVVALAGTFQAGAQDGEQGSLGGKEAGGATTVDAVPFAPKNYNVNRYSKIWEKSPFEFEIIVEQEVIEEIDPFEDMKLAGYTSQGDVYFVSIYDQKDPQGSKVRIRSDETHPDGYTILKVEKGENYKATKIHLKKGDKVGKVGYDDNKISGGATGAVGMGRNQNRGGKPPNNQSRNPRPNGNPQPPNAGGNDQNNGDQAKQSRNEVIQRLLEKARQNQQNNQNQNQNQGQTVPRRRRVVLPPSSRN